jgi:lysozyme
VKNKTLIIIIIFIGIIAMGVLCFLGIIWPNDLFASKYKIQGVDVSNHQGKINWNELSKNKKIKFVYIKATEGQDFKDKFFESNWNSASVAGLYKGAYHYFRVKSSGISQAKNFINMVPIENNTLPPVIDIEENGISKKKFRKELKEYITLIENEYNQKPVLYIVYNLYDEYIKGGFKEYNIWIRDVMKPPKLSDNRKWIFWQFCNRGYLNGCNTYVDLNVFDGNINDLKSLLKTEN